MVPYGIMTMFGLSPQFWQRASKTLGIFWVIVVSFVIYNEPLWNIPESMLIRWLRVGPLNSLRIGGGVRVIRKTKHRISRWELSAPTPNLSTSTSPVRLGGLETGLYKLFEQWWFRELPGWWTHQCAAKVACLESAWKLCDTPTPCPTHPFPLPKWYPL